MIEKPTTMPGHCPLCDGTCHHPSWFGSTVYRDHEYPYVECSGCGSLFCNPMPDAHALTAMYGQGYQTAFYHDANDALDDANLDRPLERWLTKLSRGTFLDYGCGSGQVLDRAQALGWKAVGLELDTAVAKRTAARTGARVVTSTAELGTEPVADVLHLGDVLEHLTAMNTQMPGLLALLKPGGLLIARGPLENNASLFQSTIRFQRRIRGARPATMPPYHVLLATARGQRALFARFGLTELEFVVDESAWPAPSRLTVHDLRRPRAIALFGVRRVSQWVSRMRPDVWGNRYFFVGRRDGAAHA